MRDNVIGRAGHLQESNRLGCNQSCASANRRGRLKCRIGKVDRFHVDDRKTAKL